MKKIIIIVISLLLVSCQSKTYKFNIECPIYDSSKLTNNISFFTDTIQLNKDTIFYTNSNGTVVEMGKISDCYIDTLK
jgi:uncharacterized protein YcfL